jgi:hypothetical protein
MAAITSSGTSATDTRERFATGGNLVQGFITDTYPRNKQLPPQELRAANDAIRRQRRFVKPAVASEKSASPPAYMVSESQRIASKNFGFRRPVGRR